MLQGELHYNGSAGSEIPAELSVVDECFIDTPDLQVVVVVGGANGFPSVSIWRQNLVDRFWDDSVFDPAVLFLAAAVVSAFIIIATYTSSSTVALNFCLNCSRVNIE